MEKAKLNVLLRDVVQQALTATVVRNQLNTNNDESDLGHLIRGLLERSFGEVQTGLDLQLQIFGIEQVHAVAYTVPVADHRSATERDVSFGSQASIRAGPVATACESGVASALKKRLVLPVIRHRGDDKIGLIIGL